MTLLGCPFLQPTVKQRTPSPLFFVRGGGSDGQGELDEDRFGVFEDCRARRLGNSSIRC